MQSTTPVFPSLVVTRDGLRANGLFAQAQADYLDPDPAAVAELRTLLAQHQAGVVAHFYMGAELQGALYACDWPHIHVSDSLVMADRAIAMAEAGAREIVVLGVDFMSENVRAMLDAAGHKDVGVYRASAQAIGCSLAEAAESRAYAAYLTKAARTPHSLHVVYINTSLRTKAHAHNLVPTITCTSSNVVQTVLQAFAQQPDLHLWFGPDTYMGHNLQSLFENLCEQPDEVIAALHPQHNQASIRALLPRFHYFQQGNCIVHHMFGDDVVQSVRQHYPQAHITAHLEVPGEMFELALEASRNQRGVVGSTSNILGYISEQVEQAGPEVRHLQFVLGTEAGMITAIVRKLRELLAASGRSDLEVEIVFPVASEAIAVTGDATLPVVPGVMGGEGCSTAGGCATCPFMKMNSLDAVVDILKGLDGERELLRKHWPKTYQETIAGQTVAALGSQPILHMRGFQRDKVLPESLVAAIRG